MISSSQSRLELLLKIKALMIFRVLVLTILFGMALLISLRGQIDFKPYYLVCGIYVFSVISALLLNRVKHLYLFALVQIGFDVLFETGILYFTNGINSPLLFLFLFSIIATSIILYTFASFMVATLSTISLGVIALMNNYGLIPPSSFIFAQTTQQESYFLLYVYLAYVFAFYLVAFLSGNLSERLRKVADELAEKRSDLIELKIFSDNILQSMNDGLIITEMNGRILTVNKAAQDLIGPSRFVASDMVRDLFPNYPAEKLIENIKRLPRKVYRFEEHYVKSDDSIMTFGFSASLLKNNEGKDVGIIILIQDLTEMKQMEENLRRSDRLAAVGEMAAGMAHEIRNPLSSIRGSVEMLKDDLSDQEPNSRLLNIILRESDRLNDLITEFLTFARPTPLKVQQYDVNNILKETIDLLKNQDSIRDKVTISHEFKKNNIYAYVDAQQIKQVFWNLCLNAIQSLDKERKEVRIIADTVVYPRESYVQRTEHNSHDFIPGNYVEVTIQDNGRGIDGSQIKNLFSPFYTTKDHGLGLGLAIAYRIVKRHRGDIEVQSTSGKGSTFNVLLPTFPIHREESN